MVGTCSTRGRDERCVRWLENLKERDQSEDIGTDGRII